MWWNGSHTCSYRWVFFLVIRIGRPRRWLLTHMWYTTITSFLFGKLLCSSFHSSPQWGSVDSLLLHERHLSQRLCIFLIFLIDLCNYWYIDIAIIRTIPQKMSRPWYWTCTILPSSTGSTSQVLVRYRQSLLSQVQSPRLPKMQALYVVSTSCRENVFEVSDHSK